VGQRVTLECHAVLHHHIDWRYISPEYNRVIYWKDTILYVDRKRFSVRKLQKGVFNLVIDSVNASDAGIYKCQETNGRYPGETCIEVIVNSLGQSSLFSIYLHYAQALEMTILSLDIELGLKTPESKMWSRPSHPFLGK